MNNFVNSPIYIGVVSNAPNLLDSPQKRGQIHGCNQIVLPIEPKRYGCAILIFAVIGNNSATVAPKDRLELAFIDVKPAVGQLVIKRHNEREGFGKVMRQSI